MKDEIFPIFSYGYDCIYDENMKMVKIKIIFCNIQRTDTASDDMWLGVGKNEDDDGAHKSKFSDCHEKEKKNVQYDIPTRTQDTYETFPE